MNILEDGIVVLEFGGYVVFVRTCVTFYSVGNMGWEKRRFRGLGLYILIKVVSV